MVTKCNRVALLFVAAGLLVSRGFGVEENRKQAVILIMDCSSSMVGEWPGEKGERYAESWKNFKAQFMDHVSKRTNAGFDFRMYTFGTSVRTETPTAFDYDTPVRAARMLEKLEAAKRPPMRGENTDVIEALTRFKNDVLLNEDYKNTELYIYFYTDGQQTIWKPNMGDFDAVRGLNAEARRQAVMNQHANEVLMEVDRLLNQRKTPNGVPPNLIVRFWGKKPFDIPEGILKQVVIAPITDVSSLSLDFAAIKAEWNGDAFLVDASVVAAVLHIDNARVDLRIEAGPRGSGLMRKTVELKSAGRNALAGSAAFEIPKAMLADAAQITLVATATEAFVDSAKRMKASFTAASKSTTIPIAKEAALTFENPEGGNYKQGLGSYVLNSTVQLPLILRWNESAQREFSKKMLQVVAGDPRFEIVLLDAGGTPRAGDLDLSKFAGNAANFQVVIKTKPGKAADLKSEKVELLKFVGLSRGTTKALTADVEVVAPRFDALGMKLIDKQRLDDAMARPHDGNVEFSIPWILVSHDPEAAGQKISVELIRDEAAKALNPQIIVDDGQTPFENGKLTIGAKQHVLSVKFSVPAKEAERVFATYQPGQLKANLTSAAPAGLSAGNGSPNGYTIPLDVTFRGLPSIRVVKISDLGGNELKNFVNVKKNEPVTVRLSVEGNPFAIGKSVLLKKVDVGSLAKIEPGAGGEIPVTSADAPDWVLGKLDMPRKDFELKITGGAALGRTPEDKLLLLFSLAPDREATTEDPVVEALSEPLRVEFPAIKVYLPGIDVQTSSAVPNEPLMPGIEEMLSAEYTVVPLANSKGNQVKIKLTPVDGTSASVMEVVKNGPAIKRLSYDLLEVGSKPEGNTAFVWTVPDNDAPLVLQLFWRVTQRYALQTNPARPSVTFNDEQVFLKRKVQALTFDATHAFSDPGSALIGREPFDVVYALKPELDPRVFGASPVRLHVKLPDELNVDLSAEIVGGNVIAEATKQVTLRFIYKKNLETFGTRAIAVEPVISVDDVPPGSVGATTIKTPPVILNVLPVLPASMILAIVVSLAALVIVGLVLRGILKPKGPGSGDGGMELMPDLSGPGMDDSSSPFGG